MNAGLEFWFFVAFAAIFAIVLLSAALFPLMRSGMKTLRPTMRANVLLGWCVAPIVLGVVVAFAPWMLSALGLAPADCGRLGDAFLPACGPDCMIGRMFPAALDVLLLAPFAWFLFSGMRRIRAAMKFNARINSLIVIGQAHDDGEVVVIDSDEPLAFASGWYRSRIVIAACLQRRLSDTQMRAVLAHERAHVSRHDALRYLIAEVASAVHLPWVRTSLLADLQLATEQACDEAAVKIDGDRLSVAETLLRVERLFGRQASGSAVPVHLLGGDLEARVEALVAGRPCVTGRWRRMTLALAIVCGAAALVGAVPLHEFMGSFLVYVQG